jgi:hypothetical protein
MNDTVSRLHDYECDGSYENTTGQDGKYLYSIQLSFNLLRHIAFMGEFGITTG